MKKIVILFFILINISLIASNVNNEYRNDSDKDGVINKLDKCPNTIDGVCVDGEGCIAKIKRVVHFNTNSYVVDDKSENTIKSVLQIAQECFGYKIVLKGYTDSTATEIFNDKLSKKRVLSIQTTLLNYGIKPNRIKVQWYGEANPVASNKTKNGRYKNRRVEIIFY